MGGYSSKVGEVHLDKAEEEVVKLMFPVYYNETETNDSERDIAEKSWNMILNDTAPAYLEKKQSPDFVYASCVMYFYSLFYSRLFDVHPIAKALFRDVESQGKFLVKMISLSLSEKTNPDQYRRTLEKLAEVHNERGVKATEYGIVGEVLFWSLKQCLGVQMYDMLAHQAWIKVYSRMLRIMVPMAVAHELKDGSAQEKRFYGTKIGLSAAEQSALSRFAVPQNNGSNLPGGENKLYGEQ